MNLRLLLAWVRRSAMAAACIGLSACVFQLGVGVGFDDFDRDFDHHGVIAVAEQTFCERWVPGPSGGATLSALGSTCDDAPRVIAHGGDMQQLAAQAYLERAQLQGPADVSLVNGGGVRTDFPGEDLYPHETAHITQEEAAAVLPFHNSMVRLTVTGAELRTALEDGLDYLVRTPGSRGPYPYLARVRFDVNLSAARGSRLSNVEWKNGNGQWEPLSPTASLSLVTSSYLAGGGDGYATLATIAAPRRQALGLDETQEFVAFVANRVRLTRLPEGDYSTRRFSN